VPLLRLRKLLLRFRRQRDGNAQFYLVHAGLSFGLLNAGFDHLGALVVSRQNLQHHLPCTYRLRIMTLFIFIIC
jgi:hypothetical protein